jgi:chromosome segregation ATPase|tara:strand:+ start:753 stop:1214 length:462 start_codon:yes stop_codon:yes gene_type:complete
MQNWLFDNWQGLLGGGSLTTFLTYLINRKNSKADLLTKVASIYDTLVEDLKNDRENYKIEILEFKEDFKQLRVDYRLIQQQLNTMQTEYAKEVEVSQHWERLHRELKEKYQDLEEIYISIDRKYNTIEHEYEALKKAHDKLKVDFDKYKKVNK